MKTKTINSIICKKFDDWINSIKDEHTKKLANENSLITGGCIASMLLRDQVNDFDVYFINKETAIAVSQYYVSDFLKRGKVKHGNGQDVKIWVDYETERVKIHIKSAGIASEEKKDGYEYFETKSEQETNEYINDVMKSISSGESKSEESSEGQDKYRPVFLSANAITLSDKIQLVIRFYGNPGEIHENYDFVHCTNYWISKSRELVLNQDAVTSLITKELTYIGSKYPLCSIIRTRKFVNRGWSINAGQYLKMIFQVSQLDLTNLDVLEDQLIGVDVAYFNQLIDGLKAHKEKQAEKGEMFKLEYGYLAAIVDKMF